MAKARGFKFQSLFGIPVRRLAICAVRLDLPPTIFSYCCLLLPRGFCKSCEVNRKVGAVGIKFATPQSKSRKRSGVAPPPLLNWSHLEPGHVSNGISISTQIPKAKLELPSCCWSIGLGHRIM
jgi:hypothetical protein